MRLQALLADIEPVDLRGDPAVDVVAVTHDSRRVRPGALFACIPGGRTDGHDHAPAAADAGAVALLVERWIDLPRSSAHVVEARVPSVRVALGPLAARFHGDPSRTLTCLGVTGTNGKTTTTYLLESIGRADGRRVAVIGTTGAWIEGASVDLEHTTPEATELQALLAHVRDAQVSTVAMEVSSHALEQHRVDGTEFAAVCFTNLSHDHLDYHGGVDAYFEAKARLFTPRFAARAAVNVDDPRGRQIAERASRAGLDVVTFGLVSTDADVIAADLSRDAAGVTFTISDSTAARSATVQIALLGRHNASNAVAAAATARTAGLPFDAVVEGLQAAGTVPGRLERVDDGRGFLVLVDYAHTPDALAEAVDTARELAGGHRVIVVFGCGGDRDVVKRPAMGAVASDRADLAIVTSDNPRSERASDIADAVLAGAVGPGLVRVQLDRRAAIRDAIADAEPGDVVLIAGKGHETGQTAGAVTTPFDDRVVAREELEALRWS
ncbi:MAG TPA: UDP-N-acetylmuramoyl-L-alanyl-D-glutamate--2,6-diaminopimelate ligase [Acidimicrobiia bacterium]